MIERILLDDFNNNPLADHQHGFRKQRSTNTALHSIATVITNGLNQLRPPHRTLLVALDLTAALDTVDHGIFLLDLEKSSLPNSTQRWITSLLQGGATYVALRSEKSKMRRKKQGVPQEGAVSPILFNI